MLSVDRADTSNMSQLYDSGFSHTSVEIDFLKVKRVTNLFKAGLFTKSYTKEKWLWFILRRRLSSRQSTIRYSELVLSAILVVVLLVPVRRVRWVFDIEQCQRVVAAGRNLFQRAIIHGGSALSTWSITDEPLVYARRLANRVNCTSSSSSSTSPHSSSARRPTSTSLMHTADLLHCLKQRTADHLVCCWLTDCAP